MRIVAKNEFMTLPTGTIYSRVEENTIGEFGNIEIKGDTIKGQDSQPIDWFFNWLRPEFKDWDADDIYGAIWRKMWSDSTYDAETEMPILERDGFFEEDGLFIIYNQHDIKIMIEVLQKCLT